jgi:hypothetical protein
MKRFIQSEHLNQGTLFPAHLDYYAAESNPVRIVDVVVEYLDKEIYNASLCELHLKTYSQDQLD